MTYDDDEKAEQIAPVFAPFRFLDLPLEIRLQIYHYLAPNTATSPFRDDGRPCCPSILRTSRTVYDEAMAEWYSLMPYKASVARPGEEFWLHLCNLRFPPNEFPLMFRAIRFLDITIKLETVSMPGIRCGYPSRHLFVHQFLQACFPPRPTGLGNLQRVRVELGFMHPFFIAYKGQADYLRRALDDNVGALRNLRGLVDVSIRIHFPWIVDQTLGLKYPTAPFFPWKMEFLAILHAFSNDLERFISASRCRY